MYLAYSLLTLLVLLLASPYFIYQAFRYKKYVGSLRQRLGYLPISFNVDGDESIWIHAVSVGEVLTARALTEDLEGLDKGSRVEDGLRRIAATMACHAAVKANYPLTLEKMRYILEELRRTAYSSVCPHGHPVVLRITRREVEKNFQRI